MNSSTMIDGKVYVIRVKGVEASLVKKNWEAPDVIHGIAQEGNDGLGFTQFKKLTEKFNKMWFLSKKANDAKNDDNCTWAQISSTLGDGSANGTPALSFVEKPVSFYAIARLACENEIFADNDGLELLDAIAEDIKRSKPCNSMNDGGRADLSSVRRWGARTPIGASGIPIVNATL